MGIIENIIKEISLQGKETFGKDEIIQLITKASGFNLLPIIESDGVILNPEKYNVTHNGTQHVLPRKEFMLLYYLIENSNKVLRREHIIRDVWGTEIIVGDRTIDTHIRKIRSRINTDNIQTVKGVGYIWKG